MKTIEWLLERWRRFVPRGAAVLPWVAVVFFAMAAGFGLHSWLVARTRSSAVGTVTENIPAAAADGMTVYTTHIRFRLPNGRLVTAVDPVLSSENGDPDFAAGAEVPVLYQAVNPQNARIATKGRIYFTAIIPGLLGVAFFDFGLILRIILKRQNKAVASV